MRARPQISAHPQTTVGTRRYQRSKSPSCALFHHSYSSSYPHRFKTPFRHYFFITLVSPNSHSHQHNSDASPQANILIDARGCARLTDFGLISISQSQAFETSCPLVQGGTVRWMAPELFKDHAKRTRSSDSYAFGMTILEASRSVLLYPLMLSVSNSFFLHDTLPRYA